MKMAYQFLWARNLAKEYAPVIVSHQLDGASSLKPTKYIDMAYMFGSKVAIQGEADFIITMGRIKDGSTPQDLRHFHMPKNKSRSPDPTAANIKFDAYVDHDLVRFRDV